MQTHDLVPGSAAWLAYRRQHHNASDAPAMMGCSPHKTRNALLKEFHVGVDAGHSDYVEARILAPGHRYEALARELAEQILGEDLFVVVGSVGKLSASFDGLNMAETIVWEHKSLNDELRECFRAMESIEPERREREAGRLLPQHHRVQMEQQLHVSGAEKVLFTASRWSDVETEFSGVAKLLEAVHCWYYPDAELRAWILRGWEQFEADLVDFVPTPEAPKLVPAVVTALPGISVAVSGEIVVKDNFKTFETALRDFIDNQLIREPDNDQDFADLKLQIDALARAETALEAAEAQMLAGVSAIDAAKRVKDMLHALARTNRLASEKLLEARKVQIRENTIKAARDKLAAHARSLAPECAPAQLNLDGLGDFAAAIKGKRTVDTLRAAADQELANSKIALNEQATRIRANLKVFREIAAGRDTLFSDLGVLLHKAADDFAALVRQRIADHDAAEAKRKADAEAAAEKKRAEEAAAAAAKAAAPAPAPAPQQSTQEMLGEAFSLVCGIAADVAISEAKESSKPEAATLRLGDINLRLGLTMNDAFVTDILGVPVVEAIKGAKLRRESDFARICVALVKHVNAVAARDFREAA